MKYLILIIMITIFISGIILIVTKSKSKVVEKKRQNVISIVLGIIMCVVGISYFIGCYTYTTNNYDRLLTAKSDLSNRIERLMSDYDEVKKYNDRYDRITDSIFSFIDNDEEVSKFNIDELDRKGYIVKPSDTTYVLKDVN